MILWELFLGFLQVGCFAFGGGYGAVALIRDVVLHYGWLSDDMVTAMIAVSESTPGPIMVNMATYVGSSQAGIPGALAATLAVVLPSFGIVLLIVTVLGNVMKKPWVQALLRGLKPCVGGIILATGGAMLLRRCIPGGEADISALILAGILALIYFGAPRLLGKKLSPIKLIVLSAVLGILIYGI